MIYFASIFFFNDTATTEIYTLSLHDALPISGRGARDRLPAAGGHPGAAQPGDPLLRPAPQPGRLLGDERQRSEEHTSELQSRQYLVCRLLLEKKKTHTRLNT